MSILDLPDRLLRDINPLQLAPIRNYDFAIQIEGRNIGEALLGGFSGVSGLGLGIDTVDVFAGGYGGVHKFNRHIRNKNVTLTKGFTVSRFLEEWLYMTARYDRGAPDYHRNVTIISLGQIRPDVCYEARAWTLLGAHPIDWKIDDLSSDGNNMLVESLILQYQHILPSKGIFDNALGEVLGLFQ